MENLATSFSFSSVIQGSPKQQLRQQAEELEAVFLNTLVSEMFKGIDTEGAFGGGYAEETWRSMQSEQFAAAMAKSGGIGIADQIVASLLSAQELFSAQELLSAQEFSASGITANQAAAGYAQGNNS